MSLWIEMILLNDKMEWIMICVLFCWIGIYGAFKSAFHIVHILIIEKFVWMQDKVHLNIYIYIF